MRGKPLPVARRSCADRLIPAHAGKTRDHTLLCLSSGAHPRACGENDGSDRQGRSQAGSSPRMRGKLNNRFIGDRLEGLIPAHAGKTCDNSASLRVKAAHPRACGENAVCCGMPLLESGSSPRMRGKRYVRPFALQHIGLIPAHAGKTFPAPRAIARTEAHPRACGENSDPAGQQLCNAGSSPRMRGKPLYTQMRHWTGGLIPAHAGKTQLSSARLQDRWAHPRACGENASMSTVDWVIGGSSPRMRGKRVLIDAHARATGLIPAHAGKTKA